MKKEIICLSTIIFILLLNSGCTEKDNYSGGSALSTVYIFYDDYQNTLIPYSELNMSNNEIENISSSTIIMTIAIPEINQTVEYNFSHNTEGIIIDQMWRGINGYRGEVSLEINDPKYEYNYSIIIHIKIRSINSDLNNVSVIGNENKVVINFKINKSNDDIYFQNLEQYNEKQNRFGKWFILDHDLYFAITKQYICWG